MRGGGIPDPEPVNLFFVFPHFIVKERSFMREARFRAEKCEKRGTGFEKGEGGVYSNCSMCFAANCGDCCAFQSTNRTYDR